MNNAVETKDFDSVLCSPLSLHLGCWGHNLSPPKLWMNPIVILSKIELLNISAFVWTVQRDFWCDCGSLGVICFPIKLDSVALVRLKCSRVCCGCFDEEMCYILCILVRSHVLLVSGCTMSNWFHDTDQFPPPPHVLEACWWKVFLLVHSCTRAEPRWLLDHTNRALEETSASSDRLTCCRSCHDYLWRTVRQNTLIVPCLFLLSLSNVCF